MAELMYSPNTLPMQWCGASVLSQDPLVTADLSVNWGHLSSSQVSLGSHWDFFCKLRQAGDMHHAGQRGELCTKLSVSNNHWQ